MANDMQTGEGPERRPATQTNAETRVVDRPGAGADTRPMSDGPGNSPAVHGRAAADATNAHDHIAIDLPMVGAVKLPHPHDVAFYAGIGALVALELIEWPAAVALAVGHALVGQRQHQRLREFGEALEEV